MLKFDTKKDVVPIALWFAGTKERDFDKETIDQTKAAIESYIKFEIIFAGVAPERKS